MALPQRSFNIRLTPDLAEEFDRLARAIPGLRKGAIIRSILADALHGKALEDQIALVTRQLLAPAERESRKRTDIRKQRSKPTGRGSVMSRVGIEGGRYANCSAMSQMPEAGECSGFGYRLSQSGASAELRS